MDYHIFMTFIAIAVTSSALDLSNADDTTSDAGTSVPGALAELVTSKAEVIGVSVDDQRAADDTVRPYQGDLRVLDAYL